ncbi:UbiA family prenyltransferase [bacterium]|nr:UbiA family prenyltransferase [bacterium]
MCSKLKQLQKIFWEGFKKVINHLENARISFWYFVFSFFSVITVRIFLELISNRNSLTLPAIIEKISPLPFLHYYLFYLSLLLSFVVLFYFATREQLKRIFRVLLTGFAITILVPILDLIFTFGKGARLTYLLPGVHHNLILRFLTFGGFFNPLTDIGITFGLKIEVLLALIFSFFYFLLKTRRIFRSILFSFFFYVVLFLYGILPFFSQLFLSLFGLRFQYSAFLMVSTYLLILPIQLLILFYLYNKQYLKEFLKDIRIFRAIHYELMFIAGIIFAKFYLGKLLTFNEHTLFTLIFVPLAIFFAGMFSLITNNLEDIKIDKISDAKASSVARETMPKNIYKKIALVAFILAILYSVVIGFSVLFLILLFEACYWLYSMPPLKLKRVPFLSKFIIAFDSFILVWLGFRLGVGDSFAHFPVSLWLFFLVFLPLPLNFIDIKDYEGDKVQGIKTLPVMMGFKKSKLLIGLFFLLTPFYLYFSFHISSLLIPGFIFGLIEFWLINKKRYSDRAVMFIYLLSLLALLFCFESVFCATGMQSSYLSKDVQSFLQNNYYKLQNFVFTNSTKDEAQRYFLCTQNKNLFFTRVNEGEEPLEMKIFYCAPL